MKWKKEKDDKVSSSWFIANGCQRLDRLREGNVVEVTLGAPHRRVAEAHRADADDDAVHQPLRRIVLEGGDGTEQRELQQHDTHQAHVGTEAHPDGVRAVDEDGEHGADVAENVNLVGAQEVEHVAVQHVCA